jgi:hypothetical protein
MLGAGVAEMAELGAEIAEVAEVADGAGVAEIAELVAQIAEVARRQRMVRLSQRQPRPSAEAWGEGRVYPRSVSLDGPCIGCDSGGNSSR